MAKPTRVRHGMSRTQIYHIWAGIKGRCLNENDPAYHLYGARGIIICDRWRQSFLAFFEDMGPRPAGTSIDRTDNDKGYSPENCRWATPTEQCRNRRGVRKFIHNGRVLLSHELLELARNGISADTLKHRLRYGWSIEEAITTPVTRANTGGLGQKRSLHRASLAAARNSVSESSS